MLIFLLCQAVNYVALVFQVNYCRRSLTSGYLNRPELSAEKFINNPFGPGQLYRSGDLARLMPDGQIEFLGRIDKQVKVHGYRIELGGIENIINSVDTVTDSVVILAKQGEREVLHAYYVEVKKTKIIFHNI